MSSQNLLFYLYDLQNRGYDIQIGKFNNISLYDIVLLDEYEIPRSLVESVNILFDTRTIAEYQKSIVLSKIVKERNHEEALDYIKQELFDKGNIKEIKSETENDLFFTDQVQVEADSMIKNAMTVLSSEE